MASSVERDGDAAVALLDQLPFRFPVRSEQILVVVVNGGVDLGGDGGEPVTPDREAGRRDGQPGGPRRRTRRARTSGTPARRSAGRPRRRRRRLPRRRRAGSRRAPRARRSPAAPRSARRRSRVRSARRARRPPGRFRCRRRRPAAAPALAPPARRRARAGRPDETARSPSDCGENRSLKVDMRLAMPARGERLRSRRAAVPRALAKLRGCRRRRRPSRSTRPRRRATSPSRSSNGCRRTRRARPATCAAGGASRSPRSG